MSPIAVTRLVLVLSVIILILFDILIAYIGGREATISMVVYKVSLDNPIIPFAVGVLCGHLFWRD